MLSGNLGFVDFDVLVGGVWFAVLGGNKMGLRRIDHFG